MNSQSGGGHGSGGHPGIGLALLPNMHGWSARRPAAPSLITARRNGRGSTSGHEPLRPKQHRQASQLSAMLGPLGDGNRAPSVPEGSMAGRKKGMKALSSRPDVQAENPTARGQAAPLIEIKRVSQVVQNVRRLNLVAMSANFLTVEES